MSTIEIKEVVINTLKETLAALKTKHVNNEAALRKILADWELKANELEVVLESDIDTKDEPLRLLKELKLAFISLRFADLMDLHALVLPAPTDGTTPHEATQSETNALAPTIPAENVTDEGEIIPVETVEETQAEENSIPESRPPTVGIREQPAPEVKTT